MEKNEEKPNIFLISHRKITFESLKLIQKEKFNFNLHLSCQRGDNELRINQKRRLLFWDRFFSYFFFGRHIFCLFSFFFLNKMQFKTGGNVKLIKKKNENFKRDFLEIQLRIRDIL